MKFFVYVGCFKLFKYRVAMMTNIRDKFETSFANLGVLIYQYRYLSLLFVLGLTATLLMQLSRLTIDTSNDAFYHPDDPIRVEYNQFREQFGKDDRIFIGLQPEQVFSKKFLIRLEKLHLEIEEKVPFVNKVTSLFNVRNTYGLEDELIVEDLIEAIPQTEEQLQALKIKAMSNSFYKNYLLSEDGQFTFIDIEPVAVASIVDAETGNTKKLKFISTEEYAEMIDALLPILEQWKQQLRVQYR